MNSQSSTAPSHGTLSGISFMSSYGHRARPFCMRMCNLNFARGCQTCADESAQKSFLYLTLRSNLEYATELCLAPSRGSWRGLFADIVRC